MDNILTEEVLQEMFFGKRAPLIKIEEFFSRLKKQYSGQQIGPTAYREIIKDPLLGRISKEIAELFGFKEVALTIANRTNFNAYTVPFVVDDKGNSYDITDRKIEYKKLNGSVIVTHDGFMFNKRKFPTNLLVCINLGAIFNSPATIPELVAILLHEIGHNFAMVVMGHTCDDRAEEKFADQFAGMYGYGPELASVLAKIMIDRSEFDRKYKDVPILNILVGLNQVRKSIGEVSDDNPHPVIKNRIQGILRQLEADLKDTPNLTPAMRADIQKQIDLCKKVASEQFDITDADNTGSKITKYYFGQWQPNIHQERIGEENAERHSSPTHLNKKIENMYHKKGWFK